MRTAADRIVALFVPFLFALNNFSNAQEMPAVIPSEAFQQVKTYVNPILPGDHPDLTLFRDGDDFYACGSSFHFTPYLPILHSTDLVHWERICRVVPSDWSGLISDEPQAGIWQGAITYFYGSWWIYFSNTAGGGQYFCKADHPEGPWSAPVKVRATESTGPTGYDNSVFVDDDGTPYMLIKPGQYINRIQEIGTDGHLTGKVMNLDWVNADGRYSWAEGPVMCKRDGWYYYFIAGNVWGGQYVLRSQSLTDDPESWEEMGDFFEPVTDPAVTFRAPNHISQPFQLDDGTWWTLSHSYERLEGNDWSGQGRQGLLHQVIWDETGKPTGMAPTSTPQMKPGLPRSGIPWKLPRSDYFGNDSIELSWHFLNQSAASHYSLTERPGWLQLNPGSGSCHILHKEGGHHYALVTRLDFEANENGQQAGIYLTNGNESLTASVYSGYNDGKKLGFRFGDQTFEVENGLGNAVWLKLERYEHQLKAFYSSNGIFWTQIGGALQANDLDMAQPSYNWWVGTSNGLYASQAQAFFDLYVFRDGFSALPAAGYNNYCGLEPRGTATGRAMTNSTDQGGWLMLGGVDLGQGERVPASVEVEAASVHGGTLEVWVDGLETEGLKIATLDITSTGGEHTWKKFSAEATGLSGQHDIYLRWTGPANAFLVRNIRFLPGGSYDVSLAPSIDIDLDSSRQVIRGFGGMNHTTWINDLNEDNREKSFGNDPGEIGLSILRIHLDPDPGRFGLEVPTALHAIRKGAKVFASPWNAPGNLLDPGAEVSRVDPGKYADYADHLNSFNTFMSGHGVALHAISVQNEPDWGEWTRWTSAEMVDFLAHHAGDIENRVMAPESFQFRRSYTDPILNDASAAANLDIVGGHIYGGGLYDYPLAREKGKEVWMTEHLLGSDAHEINDWSLALTVGKEINDCMKANFYAYVWWYIRRFYGLITDDGNITDKGYVLSQYTKFVRPGAVRVEVDDSAAGRVDVTAYKTDTSFVAVVVNRNDSSVYLDFRIAGGYDGTLTRFTSSERKKMVNDGEIEISNGSFSVAIDAGSVTTLTSYAAQGGRYGNTAPVASAGPDDHLIDSLGTGEIMMTLKGSGSYDPDGEIVNYSWAKDGMQIAWEPDPEVRLAVGDHTFILTVTDNDGARSFDTLNITVTSLNTVHVWLEAECTEVGSSWEIHDEDACSNGKYLMVKPGTEALSEPSGNSADHLVYTFHIPESGHYRVWGRTYAPTPNDDSFWVRINNGNWANWNSIPGGSGWEWDDVHNYQNDNPLIYYLDTGSHTLTISFREDGTGLDKLYLTNTGIKPSGMGGEAGNCDTASNNTGNLRIMNRTIHLYPNPSGSELRVESNEPFHSLVICDMKGNTVLKKTYRTAVCHDEIQINAKAGIYILKITGDQSPAITKFIVE